MISRPIFWASIAISMNSASLKPLQMIGVSFSASAATASSSGLLPASRPKPYCAPKFSDFLDDLPLLVDLDRIDAAVAALILVLRDGALKRGVNLAEAVFQDVGEAEQDRRAQAAKLEPIDQALEVDAARRILGRMDQQVAVLVDREVALPPAGDVVELGRFGEGPLRSDRSARSRVDAASTNTCSSSEVTCDRNDNEFLACTLRTTFL